MPINEICDRDVVTVGRDSTVIQAAKLMRLRHVGDVVIVEERDGKRVPVGIVTDRDVVVEVLATELDPNVITVGDIMIPSLAVVDEGAGVLEAIRGMAGKGVRRLPVVDAAGGLVGIVTLDDLLLLLAKEFGALTKLVTLEQKHEANRRR